MAEDNKEIQQQNQGGSGSAENRGDDRQSQKAGGAVVGADERNNIAEQAGLGPEDIIDLQDTGALSGRDDAAGGSGDDMTSVSGNEPTEKF